MTPEGDPGLVVTTPDDTRIVMTRRFAAPRRLVFAALTEPESPEDTIEKLVGVYRVLIPALIAAYTYHLNNTSTITDAPTIRSLKFALQDLFEDWRDGEMMLQSLIETPAEVRRAADHQVKLQTLLLASGGIAGPGTIGDAYDVGVSAAAANGSEVSA